MRFWMRMTMSLERQFRQSPLGHQTGPLSPCPRRLATALRARVRSQQRQSVDGVTINAPSSRLLNTSIFQHTLCGVVQSLILEETTCTHKSSLNQANLYWQKSSKYVWEWILRLLDPRKTNIMLAQTKLIVWGTLSWEFKFNVLVQAAGSG